MERHPTSPDPLQLVFQFCRSKHSSTSLDVWKQQNLKHEFSQNDGFSYLKRWWTSVKCRKCCGPSISFELRWCLLSWQQAVQVEHKLWWRRTNEIELAASVLLANTVSKLQPNRAMRMWWVIQCNLIRQSQIRRQLQAVGCDRDINVSRSHTYRVSVSKHLQFGANFKAIEVVEWCWTETEKWSRIYPTDEVVGKSKGCERGEKADESITVPFETKINWGRVHNSRN